jgi:hypothetical protein
LEANFGNDLSNPFKYDVIKCPGLILEWRKSRKVAQDWILFYRQVFLFCCFHLHL